MKAAEHKPAHGGYPGLVLPDYKAVIERLAARIAEESGIPVEWLISPS